MKVNRVPFVIGLVARVGDGRHSGQYRQRTNQQQAKGQDKELYLRAFLIRNSSHVLAFSEGPKA